MSLLILYRLFLEGQTPSGIAKYLTKEKIPSPSGKELWQKSTVTSILHNEKYKGDAMLQKTFTVDFLTKKKKVNEGEIPQYYVENSHPAIISPEVFDLAQHEFRKRKNVKGYKTGGGCFSGKIICSECGSFFGSKVWHSTSKYRRVIWQCNHKFKNKEKCKTPHLYEDDLKAAFVKAFNSLIENRDEILGGYEAIIETLTDTSKLDKESAKLQNECEVVAELIRKCVEENASKVMNQKEYQSRYTGLIERYEEIKKAISEIDYKRQDRNVKKENIKDFIRMLEKNEALLVEFDEELWNATIENVKVYQEQKLIFIFKDGLELGFNM